MLFRSDHSSFGKCGVLLIQTKESGVAKLTNANEIASGEIFSLFTEDIAVPSASFIDVRKKTFTNKDGSQPFEHLGSSVVQNLKGLYKLVSDKSCKGNIMVSELAKGANLGDFALNSWQHLTLSQKETIYFALSHIMLTDFIMGNTDRL